MTEAVGTYETIKALPAKRYDWDGLLTALRRMVSEQRAAKNHTMPYEEEYQSARGIRDKRNLAMMYACTFVRDGFKKSHFIPPSPETLQWGGFLGGEHVIVRGHEAEAEAEKVVINLTRQFFLP